MRFSQTLILAVMCTFLIINPNISFAVEDNEEEIDIETKDVNLVIPGDEVTFTDRFILTEIKELRINQERLQRDMITEIQKKELDSIDRALSYSANTLNFFFIFFTVIFMIIGLIGWKTIRDLKESAKKVVEVETKKIIQQFQKKITELEKTQKINILWRNLSSTEDNKEKMDILEKIENISPDSQEVLVEKSNLYLSMGVFPQVIETCDDILNNYSDNPQALFNRASAFAALEENEKAEEDLFHLLKISPQYKLQVEDSEILSPFLKKVQKELKART